MNDIAERLAKIRERTEAATEGPWRYRRNRKGYGTGLKTEYWFLSDEAENTTYPGNPAPVFTVSSVHGQSDWEPIDPEDAEFVARSRSDVPFLLSLVEDVGEALAAMGLSKSEHWIAVFESRSGAHWTADQLRALRDAEVEG